MGGKDWDTRWRETINYLNAVTTTGQVGAQIEQLTPGESKRKALSKELSLGSRPDGEDDPGFDANTEKRHALRALLLCQRFYYGADTWAQAAVSQSCEEAAIAAVSKPHGERSPERVANHAPRSGAKAIHVPSPSPCVIRPCPCRRGH